MESSQEKALKEHVAAPQPLAEAENEPGPDPVADTSYLLPFGANGARILLKTLYPTAVLSPSVVKEELTRLSRNSDRKRAAAARALLGRGTAIKYEDLDPNHHEFRDKLLDELHQDAVARNRASGPRPAGSTKDLGEAECICLSVGSVEPMLCNDSGGRRIGAKHGVDSRTTADDLRRLVDAGDYTANQMFQLAKKMGDLDLGENVTGPGYFRRPIPEQRR